MLVLLSVETFGQAFLFLSKQIALPLALLYVEMFAQVSLSPRVLDLSLSLERCIESVKMIFGGILTDH
jgi:hypothetical protein